MNREPAFVRVREPNPVSNRYAPPTHFRPARLRFQVGPVAAIVSGLLWLVSGLGTQQALAQPGPFSESSSTVSVERLIEQLNSDRFAEREEATRLLYQVGAPAIGQLEASVRSANPEVRTRSIFVLKQIAADENPLGDCPARAALERLLAVPVAMGRQRVQVALDELDKLRESRALTYLQERGAVARTDLILVDQAMSIFGGYAVVLGENWRGSIEDLANLTFLKEMSGIWLSGSWITDEHMAVIAKAKQIRLISIRNASITDASIVAMVGMGKLEGLELRYCPIDDSSLSTFKRFQFLNKLRLIGTRLSQESANDLIALLGQATVDFRRGGFLGVSCDTREEQCYVIRVIAESPAAKHKIQLNDVIQKVNDTAIVSADHLIETLSQYAVGDKVNLTWTRGSESFTEEIELGEFMDLP